MPRRLLLVTLFLAAAARPAAAALCTAIPGNLVTSCGFESSTEVAAWLPVAAASVFAAGVGENGGAVQGTSQTFGIDDVWAIDSPCFGVAAGEHLNLGYAVRLVQGVAPSCTAGFQDYADAACTVPAGGSIGNHVVFPTAGGYSQVNDTRTIGPGVLGTRLNIDCRGTSGGFVVLADNAFAVLPPTVAVPALGGRALALLALALAGLAVWLLRR